MKGLGNLFAMNLEKEGLGAPENGQKDPVLPRFFKIIHRKFWAMLRINFMQTLGALPALAISFLLAGLFLGIQREEVFANFSVRLRIAFLIVSTQMITVGPIQAGFIYTMRNYAREEHVFVLYDFIKGIRENWKQATATTLIDLAVVGLTCYTWYFYQAMGQQLGTMGMVCTIILAQILILYAMMHLYLYPMMVTLPLKLSQLYLNSLRFAVGRFFQNLGILALITVFDLVLFLHPLIGLLGMCMIGFSLPNFLSTYYAYLGIEKYVIRNHDKAFGDTETAEI